VAIERWAWFRNSKKDVTKKKGGADDSMKSAVNYTMCDHLTSGEIDIPSIKHSTVILKKWLTINTLNSAYALS